MHSTACDLLVCACWFVQDEGKRTKAKGAIEEVAKSNKFEVLGWRTVPVKPGVLGKLALANSPFVEQLVLKSTEGLTGDTLEKALYGVQRSTQTAVRQDKARSKCSCRAGSREACRGSLLGGQRRCCLGGCRVCERVSVLLWYACERLQQRC